MYTGFDVRNLLIYFSSNKRKTNPLPFRQKWLDRFTFKGALILKIAKNNYQVWGGGPGGDLLVFQEFKLTWDVSP